MTKSSLVAKHTVPDIYSVKQLEFWLSDKKENGLKLTDYNNGKFYFKEASKIEIEYFVIISKFDYKARFDLSSPKAVIDVSEIQNILYQSNIIYHTIRYKDLYIFEIHSCPPNVAEILWNYREHATEMMFKTEISILKGLLSVFILLLLISIAFKLLIETIFTFLLCITIFGDFCRYSKKMKKFRAQQSLNM